MTYKTATKLISPGDEVYYVYENRVVASKVKRIYEDSIYVSEGFLSFDSVGKEWWFTKKDMEDALKLQLRGEHK